MRATTSTNQKTEHTKRAFCMYFGGDKQITLPVLSHQQMYHILLLCSLFHAVKSVGGHVGGVKN